MLADTLYSSCDFVHVCFVSTSESAVACASAAEKVQDRMSAYGKFNYVSYDHTLLCDWLCAVYCYIVLHNCSRSVLFSSVLSACIRDAPIS